MNKGKTTALTGAILQIGPIFGLIGTIFGMLETFRVITVEGTGEAEDLSAGISAALVSTQIGFVFGFVGMILLAIALFGYKYRAKWFFWFLIVYSAFSILGFPIGTILGIALLVYVLKRKQEFLEADSPQPLIH